MTQSKLPERQCAKSRFKSRAPVFLFAHHWRLFFVVHFYAPEVDFFFYGKLLSKFYLVSLLISVILYREQTF